MRQHREYLHGILVIDDRVKPYQIRGLEKTYQIMVLSREKSTVEYVTSSSGSIYVYYLPYNDRRKHVIEVLSSLNNKTKSVIYHSYHGRRNYRKFKHVGTNWVDIVPSNPRVGSRLSIYLGHIPPIGL